MGYFPRVGDLVRVVNHANVMGVVLRVFDPIVYQRGTAEVLLGGSIIVTEHSYLMYVEGTPTRRLSLDSASRWDGGQLWYCPYGE